MSREAIAVVGMGMIVVVVVVASVLMVVEVRVWQQPVPLDTYVQECGSCFSKLILEQSLSGHAEA